MTALRVRLLVAAHDRNARSPDDFDRWRDTRLRALRAHAVAKSPFYGRLHAGLGGAGLEALPVVDKRALVDNYDEIAADRRVRLTDVEDWVDRGEPGSRFLGRYEVGATSGSSGRPSLLRFNEREWAA